VEQLKLLLRSQSLQENGFVAPAVNNLSINAACNVIKSLSIQRSANYTALCVVLHLAGLTILRDILLVTKEGKNIFVMFATKNFIEKINTRNI
jgi:hypothetical protein